MITYPFHLEGEEINEYLEKENTENLNYFNERVATFIQFGASDRTTAIRWILQAQDFRPAREDANFVCYDNGIDSSIPASKEIFEEIEVAIKTF